MEYYSEWNYVVVKDEFQIFFPEGDYDINSLAEWYRVIPTKSEKIAYYGDNIELLKRHFDNFVNCSNTKTKLVNDTHSNEFLNVWCMAIYDSECSLVAFAAQEYSSKGATGKKILYFNELREECF